MRAVSVILFTLFLLGVVVVASSQVPFLMLAFIAGSSIWAAIDSRLIRIREYKTGGLESPFVILLGSLLLWIIVFPWYLIVRSNILWGTAQKKTA